MYIRDKRIVEVLTYTNERDSYGQKRQSVPTSREVEMDIKIFSQVNVSDVRYVDVDVIGLTYDKSITDANQIKFDDRVYDVKYVIPSSRLNQILMKRVK